MGLLSIALLLDLIIGDPDWIWRRVPHPVVLFGSIIQRADEHRENSRVRHWLRNANIKTEDNTDFRIGVALVVVLLVTSLLVARIVDWLGIVGWVVELLIVAVLIAQKSLHDHVSKVAGALQSEGLDGGRREVSMIVGRNVSQLDESGVSKAAIESLAENFSDGVVAPVFWYAVFGLPGILFYKAVNTADSMIGHRNRRYEHFGKAAARMDDWMNWPAARLSSLLVCTAVMVGHGWASAKQVWKITLRDAGLHRSPNAGWPETSFAAAIGLALGGPRQYASEKVEADYLFAEGRKTATIKDIKSALGLFLRACFCQIAVIVFLWVILR